MKVGQRDTALSEEAVKRLGDMDMAETPSWFPPRRETGQHHVYESVARQAVACAVTKPDLTKHPYRHTFRHCFASHLTRPAYYIGTLQELLGRNDVKTTMLYAHVLSRRGHGVRSPVDGV